MRILIVGGRGQLGSALIAHYKHLAEHTIIAWARPEHDITDPVTVKQVSALRPDLVINGAAWCNVDGAETEPDAAYAANALGPKHLALGCQHCGATLVHVSTNEVFAGQPGRFYWEYDQPAPAGVYARSKLAGELAVQQTLERFFIVRTSWLFGPGGVNFPSKIIAAADKFGQLRVVADEFGNPSYAPDVAAAIMQLVRTDYYGTYHLINRGSASRYEFAQAVLQASGRGDTPLTPIAQAEWPRPAPSPLHAVLINQAAAALGITLRPWPEAIHTYTKESIHER